MATNLVSYMMQFLTPDMIGRIAGALGLNRNDAQSGVSAVVPALLAAFGGLAAIRSRVYPRSARYDAHIGNSRCAVAPRMTRLR